jgi:hypothetical protein
MRTALDFRGLSIQDPMNRLSMVAREIHFSLTARDAYDTPARARSARAWPSVRTRRCVVWRRRASTLDHSQS